jgi:hypothetical protein
LLLFNRVWKNLDKYKDLKYKTNVTVYIRAVQIEPIGPVVFDSLPWKGLILAAFVLHGYENRFLDLNEAYNSISWVNIKGEELSEKRRQSHRQEVLDVKGSIILSLVCEQKRSLNW